jgi:Flp pilus assembly protein TadG
VSNPKAGPSRRRSGRGRGQALVEFALVIPIFMLVLSGILDFGFLLYSRMTVINATREGAHAAILLTKTPTAIHSTVLGRVQSVAGVAGLTVASLTESEACVNTQSTSACSLVTPAAYPVAGDSVTVTVTYPYKSLFPLLFGSTFNLTSTVQMVFE